MKLDKKIEINTYTGYNPQSLFYELNGEFPHSILFLNIDVDKLLEEKDFKNNFYKTEKDIETFEPINQNEAIDEIDEVTVGLQSETAILHPIKICSFLSIVKNNVFAYYEEG